MKIARAPSTNRLSLTTQYTIAICLLTTVGMLVLTGYLLRNQILQNDKAVNEYGQVLVKQMAIATAQPLRFDDEEKLHQVMTSYINEYRVSGAAIFSTDNERIAALGTLPTPENIRVESAYYEIPVKADKRDWFNSYYLIHLHPIQNGQTKSGYAVLVLSHELMTKAFKQQLAIMVALAVVIMLIVTLGAFQLGRRLSDPIKHLVNATNDIREGRIDHIPDRRNDEIGALIDAINTMSQGLIRKTELESMLNKFLTEEVASKVMDHLDPVHMAGEHVDATVLFADIVGFTSISETITPEDVQELLNEYYGYFNACARFYFGTIDKYIGDCVMIVFGAPKYDSNHEYHAVACAILMQKLVRSLNQKRAKEDLYPIELRIGINSGKMLAGLVGSKERMEYTVVGDAVNLASRLCNEAESEQIIIEESLYDKIHPNHPITVEAYKQIRVRGKQEEVSIYSVRDVDVPYQVVMDDLIKDILAGEF
ncbi:Adenylate cyclase 2 [BD1-7 clade bacterium]|uniref:Adenylate cyclase 2 n=1 Tax=BD1-7 clade bacterium TaxID=2029982 RepID=A0A5S9Q1A5_9GAMM|nr:Adenylate cyclase 2 [BD1-7 clade bacterium]CAA0112053.1 Adenylate cyclase 2 [BD1-7 clade bacterium]